jgi:acyl transferase domain-containing protein/thioesterase domain-containing protein
MLKMNDFDKSDEISDFDVAIIGMAGRFPGANNVDEFWKNLSSGVESISFFSDEELAEAGVDPDFITDPNYVKASSILDSPELFDASFFGYFPREAKFMDPQQRLFLECSWEALEHAGYDADRYTGPIGVYAGTTMNTYILFSGLLSNYLSEPLPVLIGNDKDFLTTRVSYKLNLRGPSVTVQSACSTSLVAAHMACQSLLNQECDMALAGGVTVRVPLTAGYFYQEGQIYSPDGHCRAFDAKAKGTVFGSGVGIVVLKRLEDAIADGDCIHAVIKGSAINNDGSLKAGYTAPSVDGQANVIVEAQANAGVKAETITFIEAHGTGTVLGDPIEVAALTSAFGIHNGKKGFCAIGSVKTNVGHLDAAAGVTGLIKTILALKYKQIPPTLHFENPNPEIDFENSPFYVNDTLSEWNSHPYPRRAGVSALGVGGTNAHIILEEAPVVQLSGKSRPWQLLLLSAKTNTALDKATGNLADYLKQNPDLNLPDVAYTLQVGRKDFDHRRMILSKDLKDGVLNLETSNNKLVKTAKSEARNQGVAFMFSGQGSQYVNMGLELYRTEPVFQDQIDQCAQLVEPYLSFDIRDAIYPGEGNFDEAQHKITQTYVTQPALFVIEYALAKLWMSWGIKPVALVGHSIGEYVAACLSGVISLEDALVLVTSRGRLMQDLPGGSMLAISLTENEIQPYISEKLDLAVINAPTSCVVSGETKVIEELYTELTGKEIGCRLLHTSHAFHSKMMDPILDEFSEMVQQFDLNSPSIPFVSNVTGTWIKPDEAVDPRYWSKHLRKTVRFSDCLETLLMNEPDLILLEVGPGRTLTMLAKQKSRNLNKRLILSSTRHPKKEHSDVAFLLDTLGQLWLAGIEVNWSEFYITETRQRLPLPTYPFERKRYWINNGNPLPFATLAAPSLLEDSLEYHQEEQYHANERNNGDNAGAPRDDIERSIAAIWKYVLGMEQVSIFDDFFDLGGGSLLALNLFAQINKTFDKNLPLATLFEAPTIEQLANILRDDDWEAPWTSLVEIQPGESKPPVYFIHAAGGNILIYRDLARRLGPDQPVYGFQAQGLDGNQPFLTQIDEMAALYVKELQAVQPEGPYLLSGYCMGGTVAFEMAQQLYKQGHEVKLLAIFETYNWANSTPKSTFGKIYYFIQKIEFHLRNFIILDSKGKRKFIQEKAKVAMNRSGVWYGMLLTKLGRKVQKGSGQYVPIAQLWEINELAPFNYVPTDYPGRITDFRPVKGYVVNNGPEMGWNEVAKGGVDTHILPFYPAGMMVEPFVERLADELRECIHKALAEETIDSS